MLTWPEPHHCCVLHRIAHLFLRENPKVDFGLVPLTRISAAVIFPPQAAPNLRGNMEAIWQAVKEVIKNQLPEATFDLWIEPLQAESGHRGELVLSCPHPFDLRGG